MQTQAVLIGEATIGVIHQTTLSAGGIIRDVGAKITLASLGAVYINSVMWIGSPSGSSSIKAASSSSKLGPDTRSQN